MIYAKTVKGELAAYARDTKISPSLKIVLLKINGKTNSSGIISQLADIADVQILLDSLVRAGLIQPFAPARSPEVEPLAKQSEIPNHSVLSVDMNARSAPVLAQPEIIRTVSDAMADFILQHLPLQSFSLLLELENIRSVSQFEQMIEKFEPTALQTGPAGKELIAASRAALSRFAGGRQTMAGGPA